MQRLMNIVIVLAIIAIAVGNYALMMGGQLSFAQQITVFLVSYFVFFVGLGIYFKVKDMRSGGPRQRQSRTQ